MPPTYSLSEKQLAKFINLVEITKACWNWKGSITLGGYGRMYVNGKNVPAHRISKYLNDGFLDEELVIDHLCRNRSCVNPEHLEEVTLGENVRRGKSISTVNRLKTHCIHGHEFIESNIYIKPNGARNCRTCRTESIRRLQYASN